MTRSWKRWGFIGAMVAATALAPACGRRAGDGAERGRSGSGVTGTGGSGYVRGTDPRSGSQGTTGSTSGDQQGTGSTAKQGSDIGLSGGDNGQQRTDPPQSTGLSGTSTTPSEGTSGGVSGH